MLFPSLFVDPCTITTDSLYLSAVPLLSRHKSDPTVAVPMVVPVHECRHPAAGFLNALEGPTRVIRSVLDGAEERFRKGVVVAHPGPGEGSEHPQLLQTAFQGGRSHGIAVVGMEDQGMGTALTDPLCLASSPLAGGVNQVGR